MYTATLLMIVPFFWGGGTDAAYLGLPPTRYSQPYMAKKYIWIYMAYMVEAKITKIQKYHISLSLHLYIYIKAIDKKK
jgi:hypothetical protein